MSTKPLTPRVTTGYKPAPLAQWWRIDVVMRNQRTAVHHGLYADAFVALSAAKTAYPKATRISITPTTSQ